MLQRKELIVKVPAAGKIMLEGELIRPPHPRGIIIFAHAIGINGINLRNNLVAQALNKEGFATLVIDLVSTEENKDIHGEQLVQLLKMRLAAVADWVKSRPDLKKLKKGFFGTSFGAAAALLLGIEHNCSCAIVCRGGEFEHVMEHAGKITVPVLLLAGEKDNEGVKANQRFFDALTPVKELKVVKGASHYFIELGKLGEVAFLAAQWFKKYLVKERVQSS